MAVSMSRFFAAAAAIVLVRGVRLDEDESGTTKKSGWNPKGCTTTTTTTTTCTGADCVNKYWPWHKDATIGGVTMNPPKSSLLEEGETGIDLVGDIKRLGQEVEYKATHLGGGSGAGHAAPAAQQHIVKHTIAKTPGKPGDTAEALIDEILDGDDTTTGKAAEGETTTAAGETTKAAEGETTTAAGGETTKAGETSKAPEGSTSAEATTTEAPALVENDKGTTTPCPATLGDDLSSLRKRLDGIPCK